MSALPTEPLVVPVTLVCDAERSEASQPSRHFTNGFFASLRMTASLAVMLSERSFGAGPHRSSRAGLSPAGEARDLLLLYLIDLPRLTSLECRGGENPVPRIGLWEILIIAFIVLLLFGANRIPEMMRGLARGLRGFKEELKGEEKAEAQAGEKPKAN